MFKVLKVWTEAAVRHSCVGTLGQYVKLLCVMGRSDITFGRQDAVKCPVSVHKLAWQADFPTHEQELGNSGQHQQHAWHAMALGGRLK